MDLQNFQPTYLFFFAIAEQTAGNWHRATIQHCLSAEEGAAILQPFLLLKGIELVSNELKSGVWVATVIIAPTWSPQDFGDYKGIKSTFLQKLEDAGIYEDRVKLEGFI